MSEAAQSEGQLRIEQSGSGLPLVDEVGQLRPSLFR